jgi:hypothetical protein
MSTNVIILNTEPGIQRDGTQYDSKSYIDGQWVRFYRGRPTKIGGYKLIDQGTPTIIRTIYNYDNPVQENSVDTYLGRSDSVGYERFDYNGFSAGGFVNRTPNLYMAYPSNLWDFDVFIAANQDPFVVAHVAPNADSSNNNIEGPIYYGSAIDNSLLMPVSDSVLGDIIVSGGIVFAPPILIAYGNNGIIKWCAPGDITMWRDPMGNALAQNIANTKIIKMVLTRGSPNPQLLAWTASSVISLSYTISDDGTQVFFTALTVDPKITLMSANSIVGFANQYFWIGLNQFYLFNGIVGPLKNTMNAQYFFSNIELRSRAKIWGEIVNPPTGGTEIWWHYPERNPNPQIINTECTRALIYHVELEKWSDTAINRAAGAQIGPFPLPMMSDNQILTSTETYPLWMHEYGVDKIIFNTFYPIQSYYEGHIYDFFGNNPSNNRLIRIRRIEPDFNVNNQMTITVYNRSFPSDNISNGRIQIKGPYIFDNNTQKIDAVNSQGRLVSFRFESNVVGGNYIMGKTLFNYDVGDERPTGNGISGEN